MFYQQTAYICISKTEHAHTQTKFYTIVSECIRMAFSGVLSTYICDNAEGRKMPRTGSDDKLRMLKLWNEFFKCFY